ncbi:hypothetical protein ES703_70416 [subsurface metagenome]
MKKLLRIFSLSVLLIGLAVSTIPYFYYVDTPPVCSDGVDDPAPPPPPDGPDPPSPSG